MKRNGRPCRSMVSAAPSAAFGDGKFNRSPVCTTRSSFAPLRMGSSCRWVFFFSHNLCSRSHLTC